MSVTKRVKVLDIPRVCAGCGKTIGGAAVKRKEKGKKAMYYHTVGCLK